MSKKEKMLITVLIASLVCCIAAYAEDTPVPTENPPDNAMSALNPSFQYVNEQAVSRSNDGESNDGNVQKIDYLENGLIDSISYVDGTSVKYTYTYIEGDSDPARVTLSSSTGVTCVIQVTNGKSAVLVYDPSKEGGEAVSVAVPAGNTKPVAFARQPIPFDFKSIKKALDRVSEEKKEALKQYTKNTQPYYEKVAVTIEKMSLSLKTEGVIAKTEAHFTEKNGGTFSEENRKAIDEVVRYIQEAAPKAVRERPTGATAKFLEIERLSREELLSPHKEIYDDHVRKAIKYLNGVVGKLVNSKIAVYLNSKGEKIEAIIKLPKINNK